jgi:hypothetical protein
MGKLMWSVLRSQRTAQAPKASGRQEVAIRCDSNRERGPLGTPTATTQAVIAASPTLTFARNRNDAGEEHRRSGEDEKRGVRRTLVDRPDFLGFTSATGATSWCHGGIWRLVTGDSNRG